MSMAALAGKEIDAPLPDIHLTDIGRETNGATAAQAFEQIFASLHSHISSDAVTKILNDSLKQIGIEDLSNLKDLGNLDSEAGQNTLDSVSKGLKSLLKKE